MVKPGLLCAQDIAGKLPSKQPAAAKVEIKVFLENIAKELTHNPMQIYSTKLF
jgi:hypothetical protein